jgi:hypothetical protein
LATVIRDQKVADSFRAYFDAMWSMASE